MPSILIRSSDIVVQWRRCKSAPFLETQASLAGAIGQSLDAPVKEIAAAVENHFLDTGLRRALGDQFADLGGSGNIGPRLQPALQIGGSAGRPTQAAALRGRQFVRAELLAGELPDRFEQPPARTPTYDKTLVGQPSEQIRRAVKFTPFPGEDVGRMIRDGGPDLFMFSSDYPHPEGTNDPLGRFERTMEGLDEDARDRFYRRNFEQMMGLEALAPA